MTIKFTRDELLMIMRRFYFPPKSVIPVRKPEDWTIREINQKGIILTLRKPG